MLLIYVGNSSVSLSFKLSKNEKVEYYIVNEGHKLIVLKFLTKIGINILCINWTHVLLIL